MNEISRSGSCFCRKVRYRVTGEPRYLCFCHCESCRRSAGALMVAWGTFPRANFSITHGDLAEFESSPRVLRGRCAACGTSLTYQHEGRPLEIDITLGSLDDPTDLAPRCHIWVQDKVSWVVINDGLPQHRTVVGGPS